MSSDTLVQARLDCVLVQALDENGETVVLKLTGEEAIELGRELERTGQHVAPHECPECGYRFKYTLHRISLHTCPECKTEFENDRES